MCSAARSLRDFLRDLSELSPAFRCNSRDEGAAKSLISKNPIRFGHDYEPRGRGFESCQPRQSDQRVSFHNTGLTRFYLAVDFGSWLPFGCRFSQAVDVYCRSATPHACARTELENRRLLGSGRAQPFGMATPPRD